MPPRPDPVASADAETRTLAHSLLAGAAHAALAVTDPETGTPGISRIAFALGPDGVPVTLISGLAPHMAALRAHPVAAVMVGDPGPKGDPLTHPRLMIRVEARFVAPGDPDLAALRSHYLTLRPKAKIYIDLPDFRFVRLHPLSALLNSGFGRAFRLTGEDLLRGA
jgi:putative heme iron utilization protein